MIRLFFSLLFGAHFLAMGCSPSPASHVQQDNKSAPPRVISLDVCADQFVLQLANPDQILGLSRDAEKGFSYLRRQAKAFPKLSSSAEDVLLRAPDLVIRSYGGGPNTQRFYTRAGVDIVQLDFSSEPDAIRRNIEMVANALGAEARGDALIAQFDARLAALPTPETQPSMLYLTSGGAAAGRDTSIGAWIKRAGFENFQQNTGWREIPLERLAYETPNFIAAGFFDTHPSHQNLWSPARHPIAQRSLRDTRIVNLPGAWTACSGWFVMNAVEAMADAGLDRERAHP